MEKYENQVGKCQHCQEWNTFPFGACLLELLEWGFPYGCNGRGDKCPDFKKMEK